jgi:hypothetical protein
MTSCSVLLRVDAGTICQNICGVHCFKVVGHDKRGAEWKSTHINIVQNQRNTVARMNPQKFLTLAPTVDE